MTRSMSALLVLVSLAINSSFGADPAPRQAMAPHHVEASAAYVRIFAVVPLVGAGKTGDPIRPAYTPALASGANVDPNGILAYTVQIADDRQHALVEFVARTPAAFKQILADTSPDVKVFRRGRDTRAAIETYFQQYKKDFNLDLMEVRLP